MILRDVQSDCRWLSGISIHNEEDAWKVTVVCACVCGDQNVVDRRHFQAIQLLLEKGAKAVVITSLEIRGCESLVLLAANRKGIL